VTHYFIFDIETTGTPVFSDFRVMSYSWGLDTQVHTVHTLGEAVNALRAALTMDTVIVGHNILCFDLPVLLYHHQRTGAKAPLKAELIKAGREGRLWDTLVFSTKLFPDRERHGMASWKEVMALKYGVEGKVEIDDFATASDEAIGRRCAHDVRIQQCLTKYFCEELGAPDTVANWDVDCAFVPVVLDLLTTGVPYDRAEADKARKRVEARLAVPGAVWESTAVGVNPNSNKQIHEWLKSKGHEGLDLTEKGNPQFNKKNRLAMVNRYPELSPLLRLATERGTAQFLDKGSAKNCENFLRESPVTKTESLFPSLNVFGTRTHRAAYSSPPLNQFPKHIRSIVKVPEGWLMVGCDIVALEMSVIGRCFEEVLGDSAVADQVRSGVSVKQLTLDAFAPAMEDTVYQPGQTPESLAKTLNYALLYGAGKDLLSQMLNADLSVVEECIDRRFPGFRRLSEAVSDGVKGGQEDGVLSTFYGTRVRTARWKALNTLCQASGAEYSKRVFIYLHDKIKHMFAEAHAVIHNHDEMEWIIRTADRPFVEAQMKSIQDGLEGHMHGLDDGVGFLTGIDWHIGRSWAEVH